MQSKAKPRPRAGRQAQSAAVWSTRRPAKNAGASERITRMANVAGARAKTAGRESVPRAKIPWFAVTDRASTVAGAESGSCLQRVTSAAPPLGACLTPAQLVRFRTKLMQMRERLMAGPDAPIKHEWACGDDADAAHVANGQIRLVQNLTRRRALLREVIAALRLLKSCAYGYCEETDESVGNERLEANRVARYSLDAQEHLGRYRAVHIGGCE